MNETENNNTRVNANTISETDVVKGTISARNDVDCFKVNFRNNGRVTFTLAIPSTVNYRIRIFNGVEDNASCVGENVSTTIGGTRNVSVTVDTAHTYYIVISPNTTGLYNAAAKYTLSMAYESRTIDIPSGRTCNWNQFYSSVTKKINSKKGCGWVSVLDVANIYGPTSYSPSDMPDSAWDADDGVVWNHFPTGCLAYVTKKNIPYDSELDFCSAIRTEIQNNRPVIVREYGYYDDQETSHFVVAYGYTGTGDSFDKINVFDPARSDTETSTLRGRDTTISESITHSSKIDVKSLYFLGNR